MRERPDIHGGPRSPAPPGRSRRAGAWAVAAPLLLAPALLPAQTGQGRVQSAVLAFPGKLQLVFTEDVNGDGRKDLVLAHVVPGAPSQRGLSVFLQAPEGFPPAPSRSWVLSPRAGALFRGDFTDSPGLEIGYLAPDGAYVYEQEAGGYRTVARKLVHHPTFFDTPGTDGVVDWMGRTDVDANGFDDLFVPTTQGIRLHLQNEQRRFGAILDLAVSPERSASVEVVAALDAIPGVTALTASAAVTVPTVADINGDGLSDVLFLQGDRLLYFLQGPRGRVPPAPSDAMQVPVLREFARKDRLEVSFAQLVDINRDRRADLVVTKRYGNLGDFGSIESVVYFYFAREPAPDAPHRGRYYALNAPDQQIRLQGFSPQDPEFGDANGDGRLDVILSQVTTDTFGKMIEGVLLREISLYYYLHLFEPDRGLFSPNAGWSRTVSIPTHTIGEGAVWPYGYIRGDADGDGRIDFLEISGKGDLTVHLGRPVYGVFAGAWDFGKDDFFRFALEDGPDAVKVEDLNGDKRADVVLQYDDRLIVVLSK